MDPAILTAMAVAAIAAVGTWLGARTPKAGSAQRDYISNLRDDLAELRDEMDRMTARIDRLERERDELRAIAQQAQVKSDRRLIHIDRLETHMASYGVPPLPRPEGV